MKKRVLIALIAIVVAIVLCGFIMKYFSKRNNTSEVVLSTNAGVNYKWECKMEDKSIAKVSKKYNEEVDAYIDGGETLIHYVIKGIKKGDTRFICNYISNEDKYSVETNIYLINIDDKLNVNITNSN